MQVHILNASLCVQGLYIMLHVKRDIGKKVVYGGIGALPHGSPRGWAFDMKVADDIYHCHSRVDRHQYLNRKRCAHFLKIQGGLCHERQKITECKNFIWNHFMSGLS